MVRCSKVWYGVKYGVVWYGKVRCFKLWYTAV